MMHADLGLVKVTSWIHGSDMDLVNIIVLQRGHGWDEKLQRYKWRTITKANEFKNNLPLEAQEIGSTITRSITLRDQYGHHDIVHIDTLKPLTDQIILTE